MRAWGFAMFGALVIGAGYWGGIDALELAFLITGVLALAGASISAVRHTRDYLNPLTILIFSAALRLGLPGLLSVWYQPSARMVWFSLPSTYWSMGRALALAGVLAAALGWALVPERAAATIGRPIAALAHRLVAVDRRMRSLSACWLLVGTASALLFLYLNFDSPLESIANGAIRQNPDHVAGTSRYTFLATNLLVTGAAALACYLARRAGARWWAILSPGLFVLLALSPFGQRVGAATALIYGLLICWYSSAFTQVKLRRVLSAIAVVAPLGLLYAGFMQIYRGAGITSGLAFFSAAGIRDYLEQTIWVEIGTLHPFVMATFFAPGVLHNQTYPELLGYLGPFFGVRGVRPGAFMVEQLIDPNGSWGFHTGLVIDVYMNNGLGACLLIALLFGALWRLMYEGFRAHAHSPGVLLVYTALTWNFFWLFYESVVNLFPLATALVFIGVLSLLSRLMPAERAVAPQLEPLAKLVQDGVRNSRVSSGL
ncbi:MAG: hypothetical protein H7Y32_08615 [Chloroflexales bacterium]|nr:hypothetical protein [Chloroflexales bacterium]